MSTSEPLSAERACAEGIPQDLRTKSDNSDTIVNSALKDTLYLNVSQMYPECIVKKDTYPLVRYVSNDSQSYRYKCILMYLDVS